MLIRFTFCYYLFLNYSYTLDINERRQMHHFPNPSRKKKRNIFRIKQCSKHALLCFKRVLESGLLCRAVWTVCCTTLRNNTSILWMVSVAVCNIQPAELYAETLAETFAQLRPVSIFPEEAGNSNSSVSNTMGFIPDRLKLEVSSIKQKQPLSVHNWRISPCF